MTCFKDILCIIFFCVPDIIPVFFTYFSQFTCFLYIFQILYVFFLLCFMYTVLVKTYPLPQWPEYFMMCYVLTLAMEKFRQVRNLYTFTIQQRSNLLKQHRLYITVTPEDLLYFCIIVIRYRKVLPVSKVKTLYFNS